VALAGPSFEIRESRDDDGTVRLTLIGELDIAVADALQDRLRQYADSGQAVRLDLSELEFIDSSGVQAVVLGLRDARRRGHALEVDRHLSATTKRMVEIMGIGPHLWPADRPSG
jgi:anti-sigma B factor antagonist